MKNIRMRLVVAIFSHVVCYYFDCYIAMANENLSVNVVSTDRNHPVVELEAGAIPSGSVLNRSKVIELCALFDTNQSRLKVEQIFQ